MNRVSTLVGTAAATAALALIACGETTPDPEAPEAPADPAAGPGADHDDFPLREEAKSGVEDEALADLLVAHWDWTMQTNPTFATTQGDHRFDDELAVRDRDAVAAQRLRRSEFLDTARAIDRDGLAQNDAITLDLFIESLEGDVGREVCEMHLWSVSPRMNPATRLDTLPDSHPLDEPEDGDNLLFRYAMIPEVVDAHIDNLREGLEQGLVANAHSLELTAELLTGMLDTPANEWQLAAPAHEELEDWPEARAEAFSEEVLALVEQEVRPALSRYRDVLAEELVPAGRGPDQEGLAALPDGKACYDALIHDYTGLPDATAEGLHDTGLQEIEQITAEMRELGQELFGLQGLEQVTERLREDDDLYFDTEEAIVETAEEATERARKAAPDAFGILPEAEVVVRPIPEHEAPYTTIAYYRRPHADGSKPGEYFVNTYEPETRPRYTAEVLAFHEGIPGHHLQIAIAQERAELPAFRRFGGSTAFVEGWALYTERLADEMGLYSGDLDRMGMLNYDAWRASRLVVDTGLHAKGWTREEAESYMLEHTALTPENIRNEVDRYITMPGQALSYKAGQLAIFRLRERAREALGGEFSLAEFHDEVLRHGALTVPVLEDRIEAWLEGEAAGS